MTKYFTVAQVDIVTAMSLAIVQLFLVFELILAVFTHIETFLVLTHSVDETVAEVLCFTAERLRQIGGLFHAKAVSANR